MFFLIRDFCLEFKTLIIGTKFALSKKVLELIPESLRTDL